MKITLLCIQLILAAVLMWCSFCRLVKTDHDTHREIRWSYVFELGASGLVFGAPVMPLLMPMEIRWAAWTTPVWIWVVLLASFCYVQLATAVHWAMGKVPAQFQRNGLFGERRHDDRRTGQILTAVLVAVLVAAPHIGIAQESAGQGLSTGADSVMRVPDGGIVECNNSAGCVTFTVEALQALLRQAGGTCGRIPQGRDA